MVIGIVLIILGMIGEYLWIDYEIWSCGSFGCEWDNYGLLSIALIIMGIVIIINDLKIRKRKK